MSQTYFKGFALSELCSSPDELVTAIYGMVLSIASCSMFNLLANQMPDEETGRQFV